MRISINMGMFSFFNKKEAPLIGGFEKSALDEIKLSYSINKKFKYKEFEKNETVLTKENILEYLKNGIDLNYVSKDNAVPLFMRSENIDILNICRYFGINENIVSNDWRLRYNLDIIPSGIYAEYEDFIKSFIFYNFHDSKDIGVLKYLKKRGKSFKPEFSELGDTYPLVCRNLYYFNSNGNLELEEIANYIINETDFDFNFEYIHKIEISEELIRFRTWYSYLRRFIDYSSNNNPDIFFEYYKNYFNCNDMTTDGNNIYVILQLIERDSRLDVFKYLFDKGVDPFFKNSKGESFYEFCKKNHNEYEDILHLTEQSDLFNLNFPEDKNEKRIKLPDAIFNTHKKSIKEEKMNKDLLSKFEKSEWINVEELFKLKDNYRINDEFEYPTRINLNRDNIIELLKKGIDLNYHDYGMPIFIYSADLEIFDICKYFGADLNLLKTEKTNSFSSTNLAIWDSISNIILNSRLNAFRYCTYEQYVWLIEHNYKFSLSSNSEYLRLNAPILQALLLANNNIGLYNEKSANFILNQTDFSFSDEIYLECYNFSQKTEDKYLLKIWFAYIIDIVWVDYYLKDHLKKAEAFLIFYKDKFDINETNSNGDNIFIVFNYLTAAQQFGLLKVLLSLGVNPLNKNKKNISYYDVCLKKPKTRKEHIDLIEEYVKK